MSKKLINVNLGDRGKVKIELDQNDSLNDIRKQLLDTVTIPLIFQDDE